MSTKERGPDDVVLDIADLVVSFGDRTVVDRVSFQVRRGEVVALVGESGSGKSLTARAALGLLPVTARARGSVTLAATEIVGADEPTLRGLRGTRAAMVFQEPQTALNPVQKIGTQLAQALRAHGVTDKATARTRAIELLTAVDIPEPAERLDWYPHQLSGGQKQRVVIALALSGEPDLLIADEPTTALDVTVQAEILDLLRTLRRDRGTSVLFITHNLGVVAEIADRVVVLRAGEVVEQQPVFDLFAAPRAEYTRTLLASVPRLPARPARGGIAVVADIGDADGVPEVWQVETVIPARGANGVGVVPDDSSTERPDPAQSDVGAAGAADLVGAGAADQVGAAAADGVGAGDRVGAADQVGVGAADGVGAEDGVGAADRVGAGDGAGVADRVGTGGGVGPALPVESDGVVGANGLDSGGAEAGDPSRPADGSDVVDSGDHGAAGRADRGVERALRRVVARKPAVVAEKGGGASEPEYRDVLRIDELSVVYPGRHGAAAFPALHDISLTLGPREVLGIVGESGSGKSTLGRTALGLVPATSGTVELHGVSLTGSSRRELRALRRHVALVHQDVSASLDPRRSVADAIGEPLQVHRVASGALLRSKVGDLLESVRLPRDYAQRRPAELSGGQRQRVALARALALAPRLLVADEPTSALDVSVQAQVLDLFADLRAEYGFASLFISHDLAVVHQVADRVLVLRQGRIVETGEARAVFAAPAQEYTRRLLDAVPAPDPATARRERDTALPIGA
ncbi:dipeptide ABC transporter ATP-binding protein [Nocardia caishijiensis]|uniref:Peptide/nickel transport system ATP-binding protein n=1 Tax=Nocardia caishijiensis TaxID=184756 RepID=A0ABQ6YLN2_9NOCA|nr:ABC transporter ATP-binding protein [Nocardia caishijiensis]KAF0846386.1 peptide/nickel transport system ATP-binding protein [Nocardia caishijiensis]